MKTKHKLAVFIPVLIMASFACQVSLPNGYTISEAQQDPPLPPTIQVYVQPSSMPVIPTVTPEPLIEPATPEPIQATSTPEPTATAQPTEIIHQVIPVSSLPTEKPQVVYDQESRLSAKQKEAYAGDEFLKGKYERPFNQNMEYLPYIDIIQTNLIRNKNGDYYFVTIFFQEDPSLLPDAVMGLGIEIDEDIDGRGDFMVWTKKPSSTDWSVDGVMVLKDANEDIGSKKPVMSDTPANGDGYELTVFNSGVGVDSDLAWSRISPGNPKQIQLAFKKTLLEISPIFMWDSWAILGTDQFNLFDHNDHFTFEQAGSPTKEEKKYYPLKELFAIDNTCRSASGFTPKGNEPGLCPKPISPTTEATSCPVMCIPFAAQVVCMPVCE